MYLLFSFRKSWVPFWVKPWQILTNGRRLSPPYYMYSTAFRIYWEARHRLGTHSSISYVCTCCLVSERVGVHFESSLDRLTPMGVDNRHRATVLPYSSMWRNTIDLEHTHPFLMSVLLFSFRKSWGPFWVKPWQTQTNGCRLSLPYNGTTLLGDSTQTRTQSSISNGLYLLFSFRKSWVPFWVKRWPTLTNGCQQLPPFYYHTHLLEGSTWTLNTLIHSWQISWKIWEELVSWL